MISEKNFYEFHNFSIFFLRCYFQRQEIMNKLINNINKCMSVILDISVLLCVNKYKVTRVD